MAWLTIHADTIDLELDFLSEYAATAGPLMLGRVVSRMCSPEHNDVPEGCQEFRAKELWATLSSADWADANSVHARRCAQAARDRQSRPGIGSVAQFTDSANPEAAAAELRANRDMWDEVLAVASYSRKDELRFSQLLTAGAKCSSRTASSRRTTSLSKRCARCCAPR